MFYTASHKFPKREMEKISQIRDEMIYKKLAAELIQKMSMKDLNKVFKTAKRSDADDTIFEISINIWSEQEADPCVYQNMGEEEDE